MLTNKGLEKLGIQTIGSNLHKRRYIIPHVGVRDLPVDVNIYYIFQLIYDSGIENGIEEGKYIKINEIKKCLNIELD
jgi:hypothetical protein